MMKLRDYLNEITQCTSLDTLWATHVAAMQSYGFDRLFYGLTRSRTATSLGDPDDFLVLTNLPRGYTGPFLSRKYYHDAPMVKWALKHDGACSWGVLPQLLETDDQAAARSTEIIQFNASFGIISGYSVSFRTTSERFKGAIGLIPAKGVGQADVDAVWADHGADILLMNEVAHLKILTLPHSSPARSLTNRQREVLEWVGDGKTMQDIATVMGVSIVTVEKHLRLARESMAVETTAQAVLKAAFSNQMFVVDGK